MRTRLLTAAVVTVTAGALATTALAAPTSVAVTDVSRAGSTVTAAGTAVFDGVAPRTSVGGTNTEFAQAPVSGAAGTDLKDAFIETLPGGKGLRFTWKLAALPAQVPPEGVRYTWAFTIGDNQYQLQAKRTNVASVTTTEDPQGHGLQAASMANWFQLRGACQTNYLVPENPSSGCYHLTFLEGGFDVAKGEVSMDLPWQPKDRVGRSVGPDIVPGAVLQPLETAGMSIAASFQAVISNATVSDFINGWQPYYTGGQVMIGTGTAAANPATVKYTQVPVDDDGSWAGSLDKVATTHTTLFVRACEGASAACTVTTAPIG